MVDLTPIFQAGIALLAALIAAFVIPWIKSKTTAEQQATLLTIVDVLVYAAEQLYSSETGQFKLNYVKAELQKRGFDVDIAAIEAAVKRMNDQIVWEYFEDYDVVEVDKATAHDLT